MSIPCPYCNGHGRIVQTWTDPAGRAVRRELDCPACRSGHPNQPQHEADGREFGAQVVAVLETSLTSSPSLTVSCGPGVHAPSDIKECRLSGTSSVQMEAGR